MARQASSAAQARRKRNRGTQEANQQAQAQQFIQQKTGTFDPKADLNTQITNAIGGPVGNSVGPGGIQFGPSGGQPAAAEGGGSGGFEFPDLNFGGGGGSGAFGGGSGGSGGFGGGGVGGGGAGGNVADMFQQVFNSGGQSSQSFDTAASRLRERLGALSSSQRANAEDSALGRGFGRSGILEQNLSDINQGEQFAFGQGLSQLSDAFEKNRLQGLGLQLGASQGAGNFQLGQGNLGVSQQQIPAGLLQALASSGLFGNSKSFAQGTTNSIFDFIGGL